MPEKKDYISEKSKLAARVFRGSTAESEHFASIAVVDSGGRLIYSLGDPYHQTMSRSSIKPFQVLPLIMTGAADHYRFTDEQLSIMCGSHNGSDSQRALVLSNLECSGSGAESLLCGTQHPLYMRLTSMYPTKGEDKDQLRHNCSGKHSGFLALTKYLDEEIGDYLDPESKGQTLVRESVTRMTDFELSSSDAAIDGCSAPNYPTTPYNLAVGFGRLARGEGWDEESTVAVRRVREAIWQFPVNVSGENRFDYDLARSRPNDIVCKVGAEGIEGIGITSLGIGIGVKIHDGNARALWPVCMEVLRQIGYIAKTDDLSYITKYWEPEIRNYRSLLTGRISAEFLLRQMK